MRKAKFCVIVPAFNEERVIEKSLTALQRIVLKRHIFVVSDGSRDQTYKLAKKTGVHVLGLRKNHGKAKAIAKLIKKFELVKHYQYVLFSDADSRLSKNFLKSLRPTVRQKPACIVGTVKSERRGLISAFRTYEYTLSYKIYKNAQNILGVITVAPGCGALYRSDVLEQLDFSSGTLTEDFDLTLQVHQKKLGKIIFVSSAETITQDPLTIHDYWNQVLRWYTGFWQNIVIHKLYLPNKKINFEIYLLVMDILAFLIALGLVFIRPLLFLRLMAAMFISMFLVSSLVLSFNKSWWALLYVPFFPIFYVLNIAAYFTGLFRALFLGKNLGWKRVARY